MTRILVALVVIAAIAGAVYWQTRPQPVPVALAEAAVGVVEATVANTRAGTVSACRRARLSPPSGGQIAELPVREGQKIAAGTLLLGMWNVDLVAQAELARREAGAAQARSEQACVTADVATREAARTGRLRQRGLASEELAERSQGEADAAAAGCRAARASNSVAAAAVDVANAALERTRLYAPFAGTIAEINGEVGEFVTPSPVGIPTPPAVDLIDLDCLYVSAPIDEVDAPGIVAGMPARISLDAFGERRFEGSVRRVAPYVMDQEKQARTVNIEVDIVNGDKRLLPGYSADVEVILAARNAVLRIPTQAVMGDGRVLVYAAADGVLEAREIETGVRNWQYTEVTSGLKAGERVVLSLDREGVAPGARVVPE